jgi:hypothetical protein
MVRLDGSSAILGGRGLWMRVVRSWYVLPVFVAAALVLPRLYAYVLTARERARNEPRVWQSGQGSANHLALSIAGTGQPDSEVNRLVGEAVDHFVEDIPPREIEFVRWAKSKNLPHSRAVGLRVSVPYLSASAVGRLREIPRTDGVCFGICIEASQIGDDGVRALTELRNLNSIVIRGCAIPNSTLSAMRDALPECTIDVEEPVVD